MISSFTEQAGVQNTQRLADEDSSELNSVEQWMSEHPKVTIGAAITLGVVVGWLIKRKRS